MPSSLESRFLKLWVALGGLPLEQERRGLFPGRRYRVDFFQPDSKVIIEVNGGEYLRGRSGHSSGSGIQRDSDKVNQGQLLGYSVFMLNSVHLNREYINAISEFCHYKATLNQSSSS